MLIELDRNIKPTRLETMTDKRRSTFLEGLAYKLPKIPGTSYEMVHSNSIFVPPKANQTSFMYLISRAYSQHHEIEIAPHDVWYIVLTELAHIIKANAEALRGKFTRAEGKTNIIIPIADPTQINLHEVVAQLRELVPVDVDLFVPEFSTLDDNSRIACYAALCDGLQVYYNYMTFACGIPSIRITGTFADWSLIRKSLEGMETIFEGVEGVQIWLDSVDQIMEKIMDSLENCYAGFHQNLDWWRDIFTQRNIGSGGEVVIDGWFAKLFYQRCSTPKLENFPSTLSCVPYQSVDTGRKFTGLYGAVNSLVTPDGFVRAGYDSFIFEHVMSNS